MRQRAESVLFRGRTYVDEEPWLQALSTAFIRLGIPCTDVDFLALVLTNIRIESAVQRDPVLENRDLVAFLDYKLADIGPAGYLLGQTGLLRLLRAKLRADTERGVVRTEGDLIRYAAGDLRGWLVATLQRHYFLPRVTAEYLAGFAEFGSVQTLGPMQIHVQKALNNARRRGEALTLAELQAEFLDWRTALPRGLLEGTHQLWRVYRVYRAALPAEEAVPFAAADYNAGEFSSRNAAFQARVAALSGQQLVLDGDLLRYADGVAVPERSATEKAVLALNLPLTADEVRQDLRTEKDEAFGATRLARQVCARFVARRAESCAPALLPTGATNATSELLHGHVTTPSGYAAVYLRRWTHNRAVLRGQAELEALE